MSTPAIEKIKIHEQNVSLYVDVNLASIPFTLIGQYKINTGIFFPKTLMPVMDIKEDDKIILATGRSHGIEETCEALGWDQVETFELIQEAVERVIA